MWPYTVDNFRTEKVKNKLALQEMLGLNKNPNTMVIGMVTRLTAQKGLDLVAYIMDEMLSKDAVQIVALGTGDYKYEEMLQYFAGKYPGKVAACIYYSDDLSHKIYAGSDAFLMPSLFEPCGLSQLISLKFGTLPIVRETGGLKDTVIPYNEFNNTGTGFSFAQYNAHDMLNAIKYANKVYCLYRSNWNDIARRGMKEEFSWDASAREYERLYQ